MAFPLSRREFLRLTLLSFGTISTLAFRDRLPGDDAIPLFGYGRITAAQVSVREAPSTRARRLFFRSRDQILPLLAAIQSPDGPARNPRWYQVVGGYIHSAFVQIVETHYHSAQSPNRVTGQIGEISVPFVRSYWEAGGNQWAPLYRLYYQSTHWVTGLEKGPDKRPWYRIVDDRHHQAYLIPANSIRLIKDEELSALEPDVPAAEKRIEVNLEGQSLLCYSFEKVVFQTKISSGIHSSTETDNGIPTDTPTGRFRVGRKMPVRHMGAGDLTADIAAYELPGVPWVSYFVSTGVAFHGTYWHDNFGAPMSRGCVNMRPEDARWLFRWTMPVCEPGEWYREDSGTVVTVT